MTNTNRGRVDTDVLPRRFAAKGVDLLAWAVLAYATLRVVVALGGAAVVTEAVLAAVLGTTFFAYHVALEYAWNGQTVGKRLLGIRVVDEGGNAASTQQVLVRNLPRIVIGGVALVMFSFTVMKHSDANQRLFDVFARTVVASG